MASMTAFPEPMTAARLRELRKKRGWTQERLARELGVTLSTIQAWEIGKRTIRPAMAQLVRLRLG